jgi:hypothetical protein
MTILPAVVILPTKELFGGQFGPGRNFHLKTSTEVEEWPPE